MSNTSKREIREFCLQFLYHYQLPVFSEDKSSDLTSDSISLFDKIQSFCETLSLNLSSEARAQVAVLVKGILENQQTLEDEIKKHLKNWKLERLSKIETTILTVATYELKFQTSTPFKVVINEAIELTKKYSKTESVSFINGVLDKIAANK